MQAFEFLDIVTKNTKYLFRLSGYARSGQHAISNWIMSHATHTSLWVNNIHKAAKEVDFQHYWYGPVNLSDLQLTGLGFEGDLNKTVLHFPESPLILVVRDILNQTASVAKHPDLKLDNDFFEGWERNARQALGQTNIVKGPLIVANYNKWVTDPEYRAQLYKKIRDYVGFDYPFVDKTDLKVLERYKDPSVQDAIKQIPKRLIELSSRLFEN
jgi:hypothetical protein